MVSLVSQIENYLKRMLELSENNCIEVQRSDLANIFMCVPSQINYVLETRFSSDSGYHIETRRGGGGYIRIMKLDFENDADLAALLDETKSKPISRIAGEGIIGRLSEEELITDREAALLRMMMADEMFEATGEAADYLRGRIIRILLITLLRDDVE